MENISSIKGGFKSIMFCKFLSQDIANFSYEKLLFYSLLKVVQKWIHNHHELFSLLFHESGFYLIITFPTAKHPNKRTIIKI